MYWMEIKKISSITGAIIAGITLVAQLYTGATLLHAAYLSICVLIVTSIIVLFSLQAVGKVLTNFLMEQQQRQMAEAQQQEQQMNPPPNNQEQ